MKKLPTARQIAAAWNSVTVEYGSRLNKGREDGKPWEVYCYTGGPIDESTVKVLQTFVDQATADKTARRLLDDARAKAVLRLLSA